jgi:hypothetical protein
MASSLRILAPQPDIECPSSTMARMCGLKAHHMSGELALVQPMGKLGS